MAKAPSAEDIEYLQSAFPEVVTNVREQLGEVTVYVDAARIADVCRFLKHDERFQFNLLSDLCGVDLGMDQEPRFEVNYHLYSLPKNHRLRLKVALPDEDPTVDSVTAIWRTANWHERETYDMFGIVFEGHPDLRRILMPEEFQWHPLRKDFPVRGYDDF
jgi:NADH-quinone oxidoreductase subunit C